MSVDLLDDFTQALAELPDVSVRSVRPEPRVGDRVFDLEVIAEVKGRPVRFLIEEKASAYPRDVQQVIRQLDGVRRLEQPVVDVPLFVAPSISQASRELLRQHKLAYWDTGGSIHIDLPWALYWVDRPPRVGKPRVLRNVYRRSRANVLHALLQEPNREWHISELAQRAQVSLSTAHQVCTYLEEQLWMEKEGSGPRSVRVLLQPGAVLDAWAAAHSLATYEAQRFHRWARDPVGILHSLGTALADADIPYALTLESGARLVAPYATASERVWILVPARAAQHLGVLASEIGLQPVEEGETVTFLVSRETSSFLFRRQVDGVWVASDVQLYLDLWAWPQRGKEQARHLRTERLGF